MICPTCKNDMVVVEHKQIELDYCPNCRGVWFDSGELDLLLEQSGLENHRQFLKNIVSPAGATSPEKERKCPICHKTMRKTAVGQQHEILIDVCQQGDGLWFDGGEVGRVIEQWVKEPSGKSGSQQKVTAFLGEVFQAGK